MADELDELRRLLGASKQEEVEEVRHRIEDVEVRAKDVASVLAESIHLARRNGDGLTRALEGPVEACIQQSVRRDTKLFADALFPVMGPAIRRSIVETLKTFVESINRTIEQSVSARGIGWRLEALRTGVPFAEVVLKHTLVYRVEESFLIHKDSGLLIEHVAHADVETQDSDAVSGMLSAIRDFANDSFGRGGNDQLGRIDMGERVLWIVDGPFAIIAAVVRGVAPARYPDFLRERIEELHAGYSNALEEFAGDEDAIPVAHSVLEECLWDDYQQSTKKKKAAWASPGALLLIAAILGLIGWIWWREWQDYQMRAGIDRALNDRAGIVVMSVKSHDGVYRVQGLRDPLSANPTDLLRAQQIPGDRVEFAWRPYQSLESDIVLQRAQQVLAPPASVTLSLSNGVLRAEGVADEPWRNRGKLIATNLPGVDAYDDSGLHLDWAEILKRAEAALQPPAEVRLDVESGGLLVARGLADQDWILAAREIAPTVQGVQSYQDADVAEWNAHLLQVATARLQPPDGVELATADHRLNIAGVAPLAWKRGITTALGEVDGLAGVDSGSLQIAEYVEAHALVKRINNGNVHFVQETDLDADGASTLKLWRTTLLRLEALSGAVGIRYRATVTGYTDDVGSITFNQKLSIARAETVVRWLIDNGVPSARLVTQGSLFPMVGAQHRRAQIVVTLSGFEN
ncbi:MAG: OmpA family protein [Gammaproteobacteria bacterium]|nr:OmpA family protein [Gammaproteobacteria bacterium]